MLVISRKLSESFTIGDDIRVTIVSIKGQCVRVGIDAPRDIQIMRDDAKHGSRPPDTDE